MSATQSSTSRPKKPPPTFPWTAHPSGQWCKKIRGKVHFFGVWADPRTALHGYEYTRQAADLHVGRKPWLHRKDGTGIGDIAHHYMEGQQQKAKREPDFARLVL